jgi:hypothetical protein
MTNEQKYLTYEQFGAVGDGVTDDMPAIVACHNYANEKNLPVRANNFVDVFPLKETIGLLPHFLRPVILYRCISFAGNRTLFHCRNNIHGTVSL